MSKVWPQMSEKMINSVTDILKSGKLNQWNNHAVKDFEKKFADYFGSKYAIAVFNGTVALELCIKTLGLKKGDEVIVTPRTFLASASCCAWYGIKPVFVDVDINSQNITLETIKSGITNKTKAVILVHLAGWPCDLEEICNYCREKGIYIIEDCAQAHGAKYKGKSVGTWGDINAWSFCQDKIITTGGEGGMVTTNCPHLYKLAWSLKDHGKGYDTVFNKEHPSGFRWLHENIGTNWRMMPMQAVIGNHALDELEEWINHRRNIASIYNDNLKDIDGIRLTIPDENIYHSYYKYYFFIEESKFKITRDEIIELINKENIFCQVGSCSEVYKENALKEFAPKNDLPITQELFKTAILLKCDPCISEENAIKNINKIKNILVNNYKAYKIKNITDNNILVIPCSTGLSIEIFDALKNIKNINLFGLNSNKKSRGYYLYKNYQEFISYNDLNFNNQLKDYVSKNNINYIIPGDDNTVIILKEIEEELGVTVITSPVETSKIARFKSKTYEILKNIINVPKIYKKNEEINYPVFIKPDNGAGALDTYLINNEDELNNKLTDNHIICEYLPGKEYTVECLTDKNGNLICSIGRERTVISNGLSIGTKIFNDDEINKEINIIAKKINETLSFKGSWFFQLKYNYNNNLSLLEISTRLPGSSNIIRNIGVNMILLSLYIHQNKDINIDKLNIENLETLKIYRNFYDIKFNNIENLYVDFDDTIIINDKVNLDVINIIYKFVNKKKRIYLITRHKGNLFEKLELHKINRDLFTDIHWIKNNTPKNDYIKNNSIFIDDSFIERKSLDKNRNIYCFDVSSLDILVNNKNV